MSTSEAVSCDSVGEKLRPDLGGIETSVVPATTRYGVICEKLRPDLGGIETLINSTVF